MAATVKYAVVTTGNDLIAVAPDGITVSGTYLLNCVHTGSVAATLSIAVTTGGAPETADWIEYGAKMRPTDILSRWPLPLSAGWRVWVRATEPGVVVSLIGREE